MERKKDEIEKERKRETAVRLGFNSPAETRKNCALDIFILVVPQYQNRAATKGERRGKIILEKNKAGTRPIVAN